MTSKELLIEKFNKYQTSIGTQENFFANAFLYGYGQALKKHRDGSLSNDSVLSHMQEAYANYCLDFDPQFVDIREIYVKDNKHYTSSGDTLLYQFEGTIPENPDGTYTIIFNGIPITIPGPIFRFSATSLEEAQLLCPGIPFTQSPEVSLIRNV